MVIASRVSLVTITKLSKYFVERERDWRLFTISYGSPTADKLIPPVLAEGPYSQLLAFVDTILTNFKGLALFWGDQILLGTIVPRLNQPNFNYKQWLY